MLGFPVGADATHADVVALNGRACPPIVSNLALFATFLIDGRGMEQDRF